MESTEQQNCFIDIFASNGSLFELTKDVEKNKEQILKLLLIRNRLLRQIGCIHGNVYVEKDQVHSFDEPTKEELTKNIEFVLVLVSPVILHTIKNDPKSSPELLACANAFGRVRFIKEIENLIGKNKQFFGSEQFELIVPNEKTREYLKKMLEELGIANDY